MTLCRPFYSADIVLHVRLDTFTVEYVQRESKFTSEKYDLYDDSSDGKLVLKEVVMTSSFD